MCREDIVPVGFNCLPGGWFPGGIVCREDEWVCREDSVLGEKCVGRKITLMGEVCWEDAAYGRGR